jgi:hypothetical protein
MPNKKGSGSKSKTQRDPFLTIDDLTKQAEELTTGLRKLGEYKYPLEIRRGVRGLGKGVSSNMSSDKESKQIKGAGRTYFIDVEQTREGKNYLRITESRKKGENEFERTSINVFPEDAETFAEAVSEMTKKLS